MINLVKRQQDILDGQPSNTSPSILSEVVEEPCKRVSNGLMYIDFRKTKHLGYTIEPKLNFKEPYEIGSATYTKGYIVTKHNILVVPFDLWFPTFVQARMGVECLILSDGDVTKFLDLLKSNKVLYYYNKEQG